MSSHQVSTAPSNRFSECYPPDFDHGGRPLLGADRSTWSHLLHNVVFLNAACSSNGNVILVVAGVQQGFVEVQGQYLKQGQVLDEAIARMLKQADFRIPVAGDASSELGLHIELDDSSILFDWLDEARRMELDILSTISRLASSGAPSESDLQ